MIVQIQPGDVRSAPVVTGRVSAAVIYSEAGDPLAVFIQQPESLAVTMHSANDSGFAALLERLGFDRQRIPEIERLTLDARGRTV